MTPIWISYASNSLPPTLAFTGRTTLSGSVTVCTGKQTQPWLVVNGFAENLEASADAYDLCPGRMLTVDPCVEAGSPHPLKVVGGVLRARENDGIVQRCDPELRARQRLRHDRTH